MKHSTITSTATPRAGRSGGSHALRRVTSVLLLATAVILLAGCPANPLKVFLSAAAGFEGAVYVSESTGDDSYPGTAAEPVATIQKGIELGRWYLEQGLATSVAVLVAEGTYEQNAAEGVYVSMVEGVSLFGGFPTTFADGEYDPDMYVTTIVDTSDSGEVEDSVVAVYAKGGITEATRLQGFHIIGGTCDVGGAQAVRVENASPTIDSNIIEAGEANIALLIYGEADPVVTNNEIRGGVNDYTWKSAVLIIDNSSPLVEDNIITGGGSEEVGGECHAVRIANSQVGNFNQNTITAGIGEISWGIRVVEGASLWMNENTVTGGQGDQSYAVDINDSYAWIQDNAIAAVSSVDWPTPGIFVQNDSEADITGNTITAPIGVYAEGTGSSVHMWENDITCVSAWHDAIGVNVQSGARVDINNNTITSGPSEDGYLARSIFVAGPASGTNQIIEANTISCTNPAGNILAVEVWNADSTGVYRNTISCIDTIVNVIVKASQVDWADITGNTLFAEAVDTYSVGIDFYDSAGVVENNVINPGSVASGSTEGVVFHAITGETSLANNTICGGNGSDWSAAVTLEMASVRIDSNILFTTRPTDSVAIRENDADGHVTALRNNLFYRYDSGMGLYYDFDDGGGEATYGTIADLEDGGGTGPAGEGAEATGNLLGDDAIPGLDDLTNPIVLFVDIDGDDGDIDTMSDNDWHLGPGCEDLVYEGGWVVTGYDAVDRDGVPRTDPWSIGAYEYDGP
jgi:hypothetical protein